MRNWLCSDR